MTFSNIITSALSVLFVFLLVGIVFPYDFPIFAPLVIIVFALIILFYKEPLFYFPHEIRVYVFCVLCFFIPYIFCDNKIKLLNHDMINSITIGMYLYSLYLVVKTKSDLVRFFRIAYILIYVLTFIASIAGLFKLYYLWKGVEIAIFKVGPFYPNWSSMVIDYNFSAFVFLIGLIAFYMTEKHIRNTHWGIKILFYISVLPIIVNIITHGSRRGIVLLAALLIIFFIQALYTIFKYKKDIKVLINIFLKLAIVCACFVCLFLINIFFITKINHNSKKEWIEKKGMNYFDFTMSYVKLTYRYSTLFNNSMNHDSFRVEYFMNYHELLETMRIEKRGPYKDYVKKEKKVELNDITIPESLNNQKKVSLKNRKKPEIIEVNSLSVTTIDNFSDILPEQFNNELSNQQNLSNNINYIEEETTNKTENNSRNASKNKKTEKIYNNEGNIQEKNVESSPAKEIKSGVTESRDNDKNQLPPDSPISPPLATLDTIPKQELKNIQNNTQPVNKKPVKTPSTQKKKKRRPSNTSKKTANNNPILDSISINKKEIILTPIISTTTPPPSKKYILASEYDRPLLWKYAINHYLNNFSWKEKILGDGFSYLSLFDKQFSKGEVGYNYPHNPILSALLYSGIFGFISSILLFSLLCISFFKIWREYLWLIIMVSISSIFMIYSGNSIFSIKSNVIMIFFPLLVAIIYRNDKILLEKKVVSVVLNNFTFDNRVLKECYTLINNGFNTSVVAMHTDELAKNEKINNLEIHRIKLNLKNLPKRPFYQLFKYLEFLLKVYIQHKKVSVVHCNDLGTLPIGVAIKIFYNNKLHIVYDAHELESERNLFSETKKKLTKSLEKKLLPFCNSVITVSEDIANKYVEYYNIKKPGIVMNCPEFEPCNESNIFRNKFNIDTNSVIFLYQGLLSYNRGIEDLLSFFSSCQQFNFSIVFMGYGPLKEMIEEYSKKHKNIFYHPAVKKEELIKHTSSADYGFYLVNNTCLSHEYSLGNKIFEYIMAGIPFISSNLHSANTFLKKYKVGVLVKENSHESLLLAINEIMALDKENIKENIKIAAKEFCWENQEKVLLEAYSQIN